MVRRWDWFIPIIPPHSALIEEIRVMNVKLVLFKVTDRIINGASFCHVVNMVQENHERDVMTGGNQKWNGTIPSFNKIADVRIIVKYIELLIDQEVKLVISIRLEPSACAIKYLTAASVSWLFLVCIISGINLSILTSIEIQRNSQLVLDIAIMVLMIKIDIFNTKNGLLR